MIEKKLCFNKLVYDSKNLRKSDYKKIKEKKNYSMVHTRWTPCMSNEPIEKTIIIRLGGKRIALQSFG